MINLCYAEFLRLIKDNYSYEIEAELLARDILTTISPEKDHSKFTSQYLSLFWSRKRDIPKEISNLSVKNRCDLKNYFEKYIIPDLHPERLEDFYSKLESIISNDDQIVPKKKSQFHDLFLQEDKAEYLTRVFLYALTQKNKTETTELDKDAIPLLTEVDQKCPLCYEQLFKESKGKKTYQFTITRIYPEFLQKELKDEFDLIKPKPKEPDDIMNKICLCDVCSLNYLHSPTKETYEKLLKLKKISVFNGSSSSMIASHSLEEQIMEVLEGLSNTNPEGELIKSLRMKPLDPCNKIPQDKYLLIKAIKDDNLTYFWFIKDYISQLDSIKSSFKIIASEIHTAFLVLESKGYDHSAIFESLIDWILRKQLLDQTYREAAHIIVSYFVQSCEVFHEITK